MALSGRKALLNKLNPRASVRRSTITPEWTFWERLEAIDVRKEVHEEIARIADYEVMCLEAYMATYPDPVATKFHNEPLEDEPSTEEVRRLPAEVERWLERNRAKGVPDKEMP